jgi:hypothetical protein
MRSIAGALLLLLATGATAECRITLPQVDAEAPACTPRAAAAYDFAFCSVSYYIGAVSASPFPDANGESQADSLRQASDAYARVSLALSDADRVKLNIERAKRYFDSLRGEGETVTPKLQQIGQRCLGINRHHDEILQEVAREIRAKRK